MSANRERVIGSIRREALGDILITNQSHAQQVLPPTSSTITSTGPTEPGINYHPTYTAAPCCAS